MGWEGWNGKFSRDAQGKLGTPREGGRAKTHDDTVFQVSYTFAYIAARRHVFVTAAQPMLFIQAFKP